MAVQKGVIKYVGTIGDIRHFRIKGKTDYFAGLSGGPSAEQIATDPAFARTRENMNEFGASARAGRSVRTIFNSILVKMKDSSLTGRLTAVMKKINLEDQTEPRGYRAILISEQRQYLMNIIFNLSTSYDSRCMVQGALTKDVKRGIATYTIPALNPLDSLQIPAGATHARFIFGLGVISDFAYNALSDTYEPLTPEFHELSKITYSDYLDLSAAIAETVLNADIGTVDPVPEDSTIMAVIGIEFFQKVGENYYAFISGNAMKMVGAY